ncbi:hypothetical protein TNCV_1104821 [Trichonephila clavipes]|nr:hypothetical protein TNCV_1104821 [Trichonephila clavipes]
MPTPPFGISNFFPSSPHLWRASSHQMTKIRMDFNNMRHWRRKWKEHGTASRKEVIGVANGWERWFQMGWIELFFPSEIARNADRFNSCQVIYSQFDLAIHQNDHQARRRFVEWAQNEIAVVPDFHKRILFSDEAHFWLNGYVNKQNCRIWSEANPQVYVETPLHPEKLTVWCALWAGGILLQKR